MMLVREGCLAFALIAEPKTCCSRCSASPLRIGPIGEHQNHEWSSDRSGSSTVQRLQNVAFRPA
jgi:hypothetical protein